jgi:ribosomal protein S10
MKTLQFKIVLSSHNQKFLKNKTLQFIDWILKNLINSHFNLLNLKLITNLPVKNYKFTLLRSPHVNRKAQDQYEVKTYRLAIQFNIENDSFKTNVLKFYKILKFGILSIDPRIAVVLVEKGTLKHSL